MFPSILSTCFEGINTVEKLIQLNDSITAAVLDPNSKLIDESIKTDIPSSRQWRIYDHCSAITRLYAIYENFIEELLTSALSLFPKIFKYEELGEKFHADYRNGVSYILQRITWNRHKSITETSLIGDYHQAIIGQIPDYVINAKALLHVDHNLKLNILDELFKRIKIDYLNGWLVKHKAVRSFFEDVRGETNSVESELDTFIEYRNEASHGTVNDVLGKGPLIEYCQFIKSVCQASYDLVNHFLLNRKLEIGSSTKIGQVSRVYSDEIINAKISNTTVTVGDELFFMNSNCCYSAIIESLHDENNSSQDSLILIDEKKIGMGLSGKVPLKSLIIKL